MASRRRFAWLAIAPIALACRGEAKRAPIDVAASSAPAIVATTNHGALLLERARRVFSSSARARRLLDPAAHVAPKNASSLLVTIEGDSISSAGVTIVAHVRGFEAGSIEAAEGFEIHADVAPGVHVFRAYDWNGVEDSWSFDRAGEALAIEEEVTLSGGASLRLVDGVLEVLDRDGAPRLRSSAPIAIDARGEERTGAIEVEGCAVDRDPAGPWKKPHVAAAGTCVVRWTIDPRALTAPILVDPAWTTTTAMHAARAHHALLPLNDGTFLAVGGTGTAPLSTELFDPTTSTWATSSPLPDSAGLGEGSGAVVLPSGRVVLAGGFPANDATMHARGATFVRASNATWSVGASMTSARAHHVMIALPGTPERVFVAGGESVANPTTAAPPLHTAEMFAVDANAWSTTNALAVGRTHAMGARLRDGGLWILGGMVGTSTGPGPYLQATSGAERYDPSTSTFSNAPTMHAPRADALLVALPSGPMAAVIGGWNGAQLALSSIELLGSNGGSFASMTTPMVHAHARAMGALLGDGRVLVAGGDGSTSSLTPEPTDATALIDPIAQTVTTSGSLSLARLDGAAAVLDARRVIVVGGSTTGSDDSETNVVDRFDAAAGAACTTTGDCLDGTTCVDGVCCLKSACPAGQGCNAPGHEGTCTRGLGLACASNAECASGFCVGGVCCESACAGPCKACNTPGSEGSCILAEPGTDPGALCAGASPDPSCGRRCDGTGQCGSFAPAGTACSPVIFDDGGASFCDVRTCDGAGSCLTSTNKCGIVCSNDVTCDEETRSCAPHEDGVRPGFCVIDGACRTYGDIDPDDPCMVCDPPTSQTTWSPSSSCIDAGRDGGLADSAPLGAPDADAATDETSPAIGDAADDANDAVDTGFQIPPDDRGTPSCGCRIDRREDGELGGAAFALLSFAYARRRRGR